MRSLSSLNFDTETEYNIQFLLKRFIYHNCTQSESKVCLLNLITCSGNQNNKKSFHEHGVENAPLSRYYN